MIRHNTSGAMLQGRKSMVVILKVGGQVAAAECIRHAMAQQGLPWRLVHVSSLNQARLALARERADLLLIHHQLPDGTALQADLQLGDALRLLSIEQGQEALAAQAPRDQLRVLRAVIKDDDHERPAYTLPSKPL